MTAHHKHHITAVILAGGRARRMDGADKALLPLAGRPLLAHVIAALRPQVDDILLNSNRPATHYLHYSLPLLPDTLPDQPGPLAGLLAALQHCCSGDADDRATLVLTVPCDTPALPADLVARMVHALDGSAADICSVSDGARLHAAFMLARCCVLPGLQAYLAAGQRKVQDWLRGQKLAVADFSDQPAAFGNINTPQDLHQLEQSLRHDER